MLSEKMIDAAFAAYNEFPCPENGSIGRCCNEDQMRATLEAALRAQADAGPVAKALPLEVLDVLRFYAHGHHFCLSDGTAWDTVSGEPQNFWCDEAGTATVEDGSVAKALLQGKAMEAEELCAPIDGEVYVAQEACISNPSLQAAQGLSDREIADTVNQVRDIAKEFHATQQLRERIARVLLPALKRAATVAEPSAEYHKQLTELADELDAELDSGAKWSKAQHTCNSVSIALREIAEKQAKAMSESDWMKRALEAEELNRKFMDRWNAENGPTHMGEPVIAAQQQAGPVGDELRNCPFCGSDEVTIGSFGSSYNIPQHYVKCEQCGGAVANHDTEAEALAAWNQRAAQSGQRASKEYDAAYKEECQTMLAEGVGYWKAKYEELAGQRAGVAEGYVPVKAETLAWMLGERGTFECPQDQYFRGKEMQLSEEKLEAMLKTCVPGGSLCDPQAIADDIREWFSAALRAQADARPVWQIQGAPDSWLDVDEETWKWSDESRRRIVYTHPEASAPGLSDEVDRQNAGFDRCFEALGFPANHGFERSWSSLVLEIQRALTRASAATVAEPSKIEPMRYDALEKAASEARAHIESECEKIGVGKAAQQQAEPESVIKRQAQKIGELIADRDSWIEAHARLYRLYHDQSPRAGEEIHVNVEGGDVYTLPLQLSGMDKPRFVVHVPCSPQAEPGADERSDSLEFRLRDAIKGMANCIADPMWPSHAEVSKANLKRWHKLLHDLRAAQSGQRAGVAEDVIEAAAKKLAEDFDYPWEHMPAQGKDDFRAKVRSIAAMLAAPTQQQEGGK